MEIVTVEYSRTKQVSQYEPATVKLVANLGEGDDVHTCIDKLKKTANEALGLVERKTAPLKEVDSEPKKTTKKKAPAKTTKKTTKKAAPKKAEAEVESFQQADVKSALIKVVKSRGRKVAEEVLKDFGYGHSSEVEEDNYGPVVEACNKLLGE